MKRLVPTLAVLTFCGALSAQSSVTLGGQVDNAAQTFTIEGRPNFRRLNNSSLGVSHIEIRGVEDLGDGLSASFFLDGGFNSDDGTGMATNVNNTPSGNVNTGFQWNRRSTVSLSSRKWGELRLGRDYTPTYWALAVFSPFGTLGVAGNHIAYTTIGGPTAARASNSVGYWLPSDLGGVYGHVMYFAGENSTPDGNGNAARVGYASGPMEVAAAYMTTLRTGPLGNIHASNVGANWDFKVVKFYSMLEWDKGAVGAVAAHSRSWLLGAMMPVGVGQIKLSAARNKVHLATGTSPTSLRLGVGYVHNLSRRTGLYTHYARIHNSNGATATLQAGVPNPVINGTVTGFEMGMRHTF